MRFSDLRSPGVALMAVSVGHECWGMAAYRRELREIRWAGMADSVGDGLLQREHSRGGRAAATASRCAWRRTSSPAWAWVG